MQQAIPYKSWPPLHTTTPLSRPMSSALNNNPTAVVADGSNNNINITNNNKGLKRRNDNVLTSLVTENAVMVFVSRGCCMGHVVKLLLLGHGVNPAVYEVDETEEVGVVQELETIGAQESGKVSPAASGRTVQFPAVFIGGKLFGGLDRVMAAHISGELVPLLKEAGALWL